MGTHPIFESDFDCLTEVKYEIYTWSVSPTAAPIHKAGRWERGSRCGATREEYNGAICAGSHHAKRTHGRIRRFGRYESCRVHSQATSTGLCSFWRSVRRSATRLSSYETLVSGGGRCGETHLAKFGRK